MAALRLEVVNLRSLSLGTTNGQFDVFIDCWQWQLVLTGEPNGWSVNGQDLEVVSPKLTDAAAGKWNGVFGGYVDEKGKPVNFNTTLRFVNPAGAPQPELKGSLIKVYYDPTLPSPN